MIALCALVSVQAQTRDLQLQQKLDKVKEQFVEFDTEHMIDSLDQEKLPKLVSGGVLAGVNMSNFIITRNHKPMSSYMRVGGELGGFLDFSVSKHFAVQPQVIFTAHQNYFAATDTANHLWSFGVDIPIYFLGRSEEVSSLILPSHRISRISSITSMRHNPLRLLSAHRWRTTTITADYINCITTISVYASRSVTSLNSACRLTRSTRSAYRTSPDSIARKKGHRKPMPLSILSQRA
mgnify:CR=1 FL=1